MGQRQRERRLLAYGLLFLVLWLALGLRLYRIQVPSLWNDEGTSVALASRDLAAITQGAANDIHPPLYYYLLHFWIKAFGNSELAVRALSAFLGTLLVLLTFAFGHSVAGYRVGLIAALFAAWSPFQVYYAQETRMYALSALLAALSMYAFWHLLARGRGRMPDVGHPSSPLLAAERPRSAAEEVAAYVVVTVFLLYSHYFTITILLVQNCAFAWWWLRSVPVAQRRGLRETRLATMRQWCVIAWRWLGIQVVVGLAYLPWLILSGQQLRVWPAISEPVRLTTLAADLLRVFSLGLSSLALPGWTLIGFAALLLLGMFTLGLGQYRSLAPSKDKLRSVPVAHWRGMQSVPYAMSLLYLLLPIAAMYVFSLQRPMYDPKFLLLCTPAFYLFLAQGAVSLANLPGCVEQRSRAWKQARTHGTIPA
ncbi:MAG: hypothetical protein FJ026_06530, partial [Chloroflexi bacterium]|nr:hypothetical protein [Chloroflexota bacterium]